MKRYALLGKKLTHSYSKQIHELIYKDINIDATYEMYELLEEELLLAIDKLKNNIYNGYNVTIPYKEAIMKYLDVIDANALKIGSVNTVKYENGQVVGYNTDYDGFTYLLNYYNINTYNKNCFILGTGGAAKALYKAISDLGGKVTYVSRNPKDKENTISYQDLKKEKIDILVNSTPLGMYPNIDESPIVDDLEIKCIIDIIFNPKKTLLLKQYNSDYNGLVMLVCQALRAEEIWFGDKININLDKLIEGVEEIVYE